MKITRKKYYLLVNIIIWVVFILINTYFFATLGFLDFHFALLRAVLITALYIAIFYSNSRILIPKFLKTNRYFYYIVFGVVILIIGGFLRLKIGNNFVNENFPPTFHKYPGYGISFGAVFVLMIISTSIKLIEIHLQRNEIENRILQEKNEAELKLLKSQINPHFLFNTLNNIYTLAHLGSKEVAPMIMSLSRLMRYILNEADNDRVPIENEIQFLKSYIELETLRIEDHSKIMADYIINNPNIEIAPLIFIPFIENSFKHSHIADDDNAWIKLKTEVSDKTLYFECSNSIPDKHFKNLEISGIGLQNIKNRLELLYPFKHELKIINDNKIFRVNLIIDLI
ncbi:MAG: histidine kinase [Bacteroidales bacterium]|nr:histidine kinase [Bacteroidales bacterium]